MVRLVTIPSKGAGRSVCPTTSSAPVRRARAAAMLAWLAAAGEHPYAARSVGVEPSLIRLAALVIGGALCALGGAELAAGSLQFFSQNMTAGRGFMAFAAVIFGGGNPLGATGAAFFFAIVGALGIRAQLLFGERVPPDFLLALPYIATVIGVWISGKLRGGAKAAASFGELKDY